MLFGDRAAVKAPDARALLKNGATAGFPAGPTSRDAGAARENSPLVGADREYATGTGKK